MKNFASLFERHPQDLNWKRIENPSQYFIADGLQLSKNAYSAFLDPEFNYDGEYYSEIAWAYYLDRYYLVFKNLKNEKVLLLDRNINSSRSAQARAISILNGDPILT